MSNFDIKPLLRMRLIEALLEEGVCYAEAEKFADETLESAKRLGAELRARQEDSQ